ncbi:MAG: hypothetical protein HFJ09_02275 [Lachnospiraceae bacterium]|nr:hypothetical protein [Lachnospiraceae bacterium]
MEKNDMDSYRLINMFNQLDASFLEELHLEKDLRRHQRMLRRFFSNRYVKTATTLAGIGLLVTSILGFYFYMKEDN